MFPAYLLLWIVLNGRIDLQILLFGIALSLALTAFTAFLTGRSLRRELTRCFSVFGYARYFALLVREVLKSGFAMAGWVLRPGRTPHPVLLTFTLPLKSEAHRVLYANSITLTPGTITAELTGDTYRVHMLDASMADGLKDGPLVRELLRKEARA